MKILIFGGNGMLGHQLVKSLSVNHEVDVAPRGQEVLSLQTKHDVVINAAGIVKQRNVSDEEMIRTNALLPHTWARHAAAVGARFIHFSTDCVFSGRRGHYTEFDRPDPVDTYGRSKLLGEVSYPGCVTLRTSIIGREVWRKQGLLEWFLAQRDLVGGHTNAVFNGLTTIEMARVVEHVLAKPSASGLFHVGSYPITKCDLLVKLKKHYDLPATILPDDSVECNRVLNSGYFENVFDYMPPTWNKMIGELE